MSARKCSSKEQARKQVQKRMISLDKKLRIGIRQDTILAAWYPETRAGGRAARVCCDDENVHEDLDSPRFLCTEHHPLDTLYSMSM